MTPPEELVPAVRIGLTLPSCCAVQKDAAEHRLVLLMKG
jgi:hypothetical protein